MAAKETEKMTIEQVADALGVSKTTVSRALSGKGRISEETRAKVYAYLGRTRTEPAADTELTKNQAVTLYVSLGSTKMPELKQQTKANADALLKAMGLNLKVTFLEEESDTVEEGSVTRTEPASGSELSKGQSVTVYISKGNGKVNVPPVKGLDVMDAIKLLRENNLKYEIKRVFNEKEEKDRVISQSEEPNTQVPKDTIVILEVSDGPAPTDPPTQPPTEPTQPSTDPTQPSENPAG